MYSTTPALRLREKLTHPPNHKYWISKLINHVSLSINWSKFNKIPITKLKLLHNKNINKFGHILIILYMFLQYKNKCFYNQKTNSYTVGILAMPLNDSLLYHVPVCLNEHYLSHLLDIIQKITTSQLCGSLVVPEIWIHFLRFYLKEMKK